MLVFLQIKCELLADGPPCERCKRKNIECIINTGLRNSILDQRYELPPSSSPTVMSPCEGTTRHRRDQGKQHAR